MTLPDPASASGRVDWHTILKHTLPHVDIFVPSLQEARFMLDRSTQNHPPTMAEVRQLTDRLLGMGDLAITGIKLGEYGVWLRSGSRQSLARLRSRGVAHGIEPDLDFYHPAFDVQVAGTTGAGDAAYAGLLIGLTRGLDLFTCAQMMCAVGGCNVEAPDATSGVQSWNATQARVASGWALGALRLPDV
jgi:sugar/nucleoside kinase (ribokinase family)